MSHEKASLIKMLNHIAINNASVGDEHTVAQVIEGHVQKFWSRRMKEQLHELIQHGCDDLHNAARLAGQRLCGIAG